MEFEDLQEKYPDKKVFDRIPLAADAAHLLTDYLETLNAEFVRRKIEDPYKTTKEFEEILVQELKEKGNTTKLTYDAVSEKLDNFGSPHEVVKKYILTHQPQLLAKQEKIVEKTPDDLLDIETIGKRTGRGFILLLLSINLILSTIFCLILFSNSFYAWINEYSLANPFAFFLIYTVYEIIAGSVDDNKLTGQEEYFFRYSMTTLMVFYLVLNTTFILSRSSSNTTYAIFTVIFLGMFYIRDHVSLFSPVPNKNRPLARFLLPSYITLGLSYFIGFSALYIEKIDIISNSYRIFVITLIYVMGLLSLALEIPRKYPISIRKLLFTAFVPFLVFQFSTYKFGSRYYYRFHSENLFVSFLIYYLLFLLILIVVFRQEIRLALISYQNTLAEYRDRVNFELEEYGKKEPKK